MPSARVKYLPDMSRPLGGSGTTALACQFLGVHPTIIEVNPFLADLIESKLSGYNVDALAYDFGNILRHLRTNPATSDFTFEAAPKTFVEPGLKGRWIIPPRGSQSYWLLASSNKPARRQVS